MGEISAFDEVGGEKSTLKNAGSVRGPAMAFEVFPEGVTAASRTPLLLL